MESRQSAGNAVVLRQALLLNRELTAAQVRDVQRRVATGELHRIARGMATALPPEQWPALVKREQVRIAAAEFPGAVVGFRSAFEGMVGETLYLTYTHARTLELPGLRIVGVAGPGPAAGDRKMAGRELYFPSQARLLLDNLTRNDGNRNVSREQVEQRLVQISEAAGEERLKTLRAEIDAAAAALGRPTQAKLLRGMIGALLGTRPVDSLVSSAARAVASQYDPTRLELFDKLITALRTTPLPSIADVAALGQAMIHFGFLESYFSNFIEGTEFEVQEARAIVLEGKIIEERPKDSHDIVGVFEQIVSPGWRLQALAQAPGVLNQLMQRHAQMMKARPDVRPGEFKLKVNRAGNTRFVQPGLVRGTILEGARRLSELEPGMARALYAMFLVSEVHPFDDGNGRLARLVMNAELSQAGQCRIIIPTLYRETYLDCLRALSREADPKPYIKAMVDIQRWTAQFDYDNLQVVIDAMAQCNAFERSLAQFRLRFPADLPVQVEGLRERPQG